MCIILLIEDDLIDQMAFTRMIQNQGLQYQCIPAKSIIEAKQLLHEKSFDLVISDYNLADGTTFDLIEDIHNTPLVVITGNEDEATKAAVIENGAVACLTKDLNLTYLDALPKIINNIVDNQTAEPLPVFQNREVPLLQEGDVTINLSRLNDFFDHNNQALRETIELFLIQKPRELEELRRAIFFEKDCNTAAKITHRMKSGFRIFGMKKQEKLATGIENVAITTGCECDTLMDAFNSLSSDMKTAVKLLEKELPLL